MCDGRVDFERLARLEDATVLAQAAERPHVVQAVGKLDDDDADVLVHRHEHLADGGSLLVGERGNLDLGDLGDSLNERCDVFAKALDDVLARYFGIFDRVVQKRCNECLNVHVQSSEDDGDLDGMYDVGLA